MKIIDRKSFLDMPENTIYSKYQPIQFGELAIKGDSIIMPEPLAGDWFYQSVNDAIESEGSSDFFEKLGRAEKLGISLAIDLDNQDRDGLFDHDQLFAIWEKSDIEKLINRLTECLI